MAVCLFCLLSRTAALTKNTATTFLMAQCLNWRLLHQQTFQLVAVRQFGLSCLVARLLKFVDETYKVSSIK